MKSLLVVSFFVINALFHVLYTQEAHAQVSKFCMGSSHACAIFSGRAVCWGDNSDGQLGNGTLTASTTPVDVVSLGDNVTAISCANTTTCAVADGALKCWGRGHGAWGPPYGRFPVPVRPLSAGVTAVSVSGNYSCAVQYGTVQCWGLGLNGELGNGDGPIESYFPTQVIGLETGVVAVTTGTSACAITGNGGVKCWGSNSFGALGDGTNIVKRATAGDVVGLSSGVTVLRGGGSPLCVLVSGAVKCWGYNGKGAVGDGTTVHRNVPVDVVGLSSGVTALAAGPGFACAVVSGAVKCWGDNGEVEHFGASHSHLLMSSVPLDVTELSNGVIQLWEPSVTRQACALTGSYQLKCWAPFQTIAFPQPTPTPTPTPGETVVPLIPTATPTAIPTSTPAGFMGISINDGAAYTNSTAVTLNVTYPSDTNLIYVSNDGGFSNPTAFPPQNTVPWELVSSGAERLPKMVYVRFDSSPYQYSDDIILDLTAPIIVEAAGRKVRSLAKSLNRITVRIRVNDKTSGVSGVRFEQNRQAITAWLPYKTRMTVTVPASRPLYIQARDAAGNMSRRRRIGLR